MSKHADGDGSSASIVIDMAGSPRLDSSLGAVPGPRQEARSMTRLKLFRGDEDDVDPLQWAALMLKRRQTAFIERCRREPPGPFQGESYPIFNLDSGEQVGVIRRRGRPLKQTMIAFTEIRRMFRRVRRFIRKHVGYV